MSEKEVVLERLAEREKKDKANQLMLKLFITTSSIIFGTLLLVWLIRSLPSSEIPYYYQLSVLPVIAVSYALVRALRNIRADKLKTAAAMVMVALLMVVTLVLLQVLGWIQLLEESSNDLLLPFTIMHVLHIGVGSVLLFDVYRKLGTHKIHGKSVRYAQSIFTFWHFLAAVWVLVCWIYS